MGQHPSQQRGLSRSARRKQEDKEMGEPESTMQREQTERPGAGMNQEFQNLQIMFGEDVPEFDKRDVYQQVNEPRGEEANGASRRAAGGNKRLFQSTNDASRYRSAGQLQPERPAANETGP